jgi:hypothetical protein
MAMTSPGLSGLEGGGFITATRDGCTLSAGAHREEGAWPSSPLSSCWASGTSPRTG